MEGGAYTGKFNSTGGHILADHCIELLRFFNNKVDNFPIEDFWNMLDSTMTIEEREQSNKKRYKNAKKRYDKFNPSHIKRPKTAMNLYRVDYKANIIKEGKVYSNEEFNKVWANIDKNTLAKYENLYHQKMEQYNKDYNNAMKQAIIDGEYEAPEPKKPMSGYFLFQDLCRRHNSNILTEKQKQSIEGLSITEATKILSEYYHEFIKNENNLKLLEMNKEQYKMLYNYNMYHWNISRLEGAIKRLQRENKDTKYKEKELQDYKNSVEFDVSKEPLIDIDWIYNFNNNSISKSSISTKSNPRSTNNKHNSALDSNSELNTSITKVEKVNSDIQDNESLSVDSNNITFNIKSSKSTNSGKPNLKPKIKSK